MILYPPTIFIITEGIPRESGDDPPQSLKTLREERYSPRERG